MEILTKQYNAKLDATINKIIANIMKTHDKDSSGFLDRQETRKLIADIL